ncbi:hypothetical protein BH20ACT2_BH20ACT2_01340 [soil metagenome]
MATTISPSTDRKERKERKYALREMRSVPPIDDSDSAAEDQGRFLSRWLKVWIALLTVVTLVVVVYLIAITNSLAAINGNLATADAAVTGAGGNTQTLPDQVQGINASLSGIDPALQPIPGQADQIIGLLSSIDGKLADTDASLIDTSGSLQDTSSQLGDTSGVLEAVLGDAGSIRNTLFEADEPNGPCAEASCTADKDGVQNIHQRVAIANAVLIPAEADAGNILAGLVQANQNLSSICLTTSVGGLTAPC